MAKNGTMYEDDDYYYYIPDNCTSATSVNLYVGDGGGSEGKDKINRGLENNGCDSIILIPKKDYSSPSSSLSILNDFYADFKKKYGITLDSSKASVSGWSIGADYAAYVAEASYNGSSGVQVKNIIAIDGAYNGWSASADASSFVQKLGEAGGTMVVVSAWEPRTYTWSDRAEELAKAGGTAIKVVLTNGSDAGHAWAQELTYRCNIAGILSGGQINPDYSTGNKTIAYHFQIYDTNQNAWVEMSAEELQERIKSGEISADALSNAINAATNPLGIEEVESDDEVLKGYMDEIRNLMKGTSFLTSSIPSYASTTSTPNNEGKEVINFFKATSVLLQKLTLDTQYLLEIGQSLKDVDDILKAKLNELNVPDDLQESTKKLKDVLPTEEKASMFVKGIAAGAVVGAIVGTALTPVGTVVGAVVGAVVGVVATLIQLNQPATGTTSTDTTSTSATSSTPSTTSTPNR